MLKMLAIVLLAGMPLGACLEEDSPTTTTEQEVSKKPLPPLSADQEYAYFQGNAWTFQFPGYFSPEAETFFIWNFGTSIQHGAPYPSSSHEQLYAVFAPGPAGATHHTDEADPFDHYHILGKVGGTRTYDAFLVFPGPNFNAATWDAPRSVDEMNDRIASGELGAPLLTTQAGFDPLVITVPTKRHGN